MATSSPKVPRSMIRPVVEDEDEVGIGDRGEPVGDDEGGAALPQPIERPLDACLGLDVEGAGRLVEDQDRRILQDGAGDGEALALAAGERCAALADDEGDSRRACWR